MGYWVHGKLDRTSITVTAKTAYDAVERARELASRGTREIRIEDEDHKDLTLEDIEGRLVEPEPR
jgi:hypothetical protein